MRELRHPGDTGVADRLSEAPALAAQRTRAGLLRLKSALFDPITGLHSYHLRLDELNSRIEGRPLGVLVLDFPELAAVEMTHGWEVTDRLLAGVASLLGALVGRTLPGSTLVTLDGVYGNSFLLFQQDAPGGGDVVAADLHRSATSLARHLQARLATAEWAPGDTRVEFSVGTALVRPNASARFERLLHQGIRDARAQILRETDRQQIERALELRAILEGARLTTHYQPIVDMDQGSIMGYEALTRGPVNSTLEGPDVLFALSDSVHLSSELDALCLREAVKNARGFDPSKKLFLNSLSEGLEARGFKNGGLLEALGETPLQPRNLVLEISERTAIADFEVFGRDLAQIRRLGFLVAIDDVGTGYSSLQAISEVQPDFIKVDISLIKNIHRSLIKQELVRSLLQVAVSFGAKVIAEGIEIPEECRTLRRCGVRYGQGFFFARPALPFPALERGTESML